MIPLRLWVHEPREITESLLTRWARKNGQRTAEEMERFRSRIADLIADDESLENVRLVFDRDPESIEYRLRDAAGGYPRSGLNGLIEGEIGLSDARARTLLEAQGSTDGWLTLRVISEGHEGAGAIRLIEDRGLSLVSDIDDTIKITGIPEGREVVLENTFFRPFVAVPGMAERYRALIGPDTVFHYVSGGPWQLYQPLAEFMAEADFPPGSIHMKSVRKNLLTPGAWQDVAALAAGDATVDQKLAQISAIFERFPNRRFILVGDSGEHDPEVYREIRSTYPGQVEAIWIRDVVDARRLYPKRVEGMEIIGAREGTRSILRE